MSWYVGASLDQLLAEINASAPNRSKASDGSIGDANHSSRESDHNPCDCHDAVCARDYTHDPAGGFDSYAFANWLAERTKHDESRVKYIISNGRIASGQGQSYPAGVWRTYTGSNPHDHHCHVSVRHGPEHFNDTRSWNWSGAGSTPEPDVPEPIGAPDMFIAIDGVALAALFGSVIFQFADLKVYGDAKNASPNVPAMVIPSSTPMADRQHLWQQLILQHVVAVGEGS
jgi:hypothetical protein